MLKIQNIINIRIIIGHISSLYQFPSKIYNLMVMRFGPF